MSGLSHLVPRKVIQEFPRRNERPRESARLPGLIPGVLQEIHRRCSHNVHEPVGYERARLVPMAANRNTSVPKRLFCSVRLLFPFQPVKFCIELSAEFCQFFLSFVIIARSAEVGADLE